MLPDIIQSLVFEFSEPRSLAVFSSCSRAHYAQVQEKVQNLIQNSKRISSAQRKTVSRLRCSRTHALDVMLLQECILCREKWTGAITAINGIPAHGTCIRKKLKREDRRLSRELWHKQRTATRDAKPYMRQIMRKFNK